MIVNVNGEKFAVSVSYDDTNTTSTLTESPVIQGETPEVSGETKEVVAPLEGIFFLTKESSEKAVKVGDTIKEGDLLGYIEAMKTMNAIKAESDGIIASIQKENGADVEEEDVLFLIK